MQKCFLFICRPMLLHHMTLVFFRLLRENLGNLQKCLDKWSTAAPWQKIARTPMASRATQWCIRQSLGQVRQVELERVCCWLFARFAYAVHWLKFARFESNRCRGWNRVKQAHSLSIGRHLFLLPFKSILSKLYLVCDRNSSLVSLWRANCSNIHEIDISIV